MDMLSFEFKITKNIEVTEKVIKASCQADAWAILISRINLSQVDKIVLVSVR